MLGTEAGGITATLQLVESEPLGICQAPPNERIGGWAVYGRGVSGAFLASFAP